MILSGRTDKIPLYGNSIKALAEAMSTYISNDDDFEKLIKKITKKIAKVMESKTIDAGELRDFIKGEAVGKEILHSFTTIKNPLAI